MTAETLLLAAGDLMRAILLLVLLGGAAVFLSPLAERARTFHARGMARLAADRSRTENPAARPDTGLHAD